MRITPTTTAAVAPLADGATRVVAASSTALSVEDELRDLRIDGYDVVFVQRVALLPAEIDERATRRERSAMAGEEVGRG